MSGAKTAKKSTEAQLMEVFSLLHDRFGPCHWWPAESVVEMIIGAILAQNVSWKNVETALGHLQNQDLMSLEGVRRVPVEVLEELIRSTRYYKTKARKLKAFVEYVDAEHGGDLQALLALPLWQQREELLGIYGIGQETADSIILYGSGQPIFVIDAYTKRIFQRLGYFDEKIEYQGMQQFFMGNLPQEAKLFNEYHALLDSLGKSTCMKNNPDCSSCPLAELCRYRNQSVMEG